MKRMNLSYNKAVYDAVNLELNPIKKATSIASNDVELKVGYASGQSVSLTLKDADNKALANKTINYTFNTETPGSVTTGPDGTATIDIENSLSIGQISLLMEFEGDKLYLASNKTININVVSASE